MIFHADQKDRSLWERDCLMVYHDETFVILLSFHSRRSYCLNAWNRVEKLFLNWKPDLITRIRALREKGQFKPLWIPLLYFNFLDCLREPSNDNTDTDDEYDTRNCDDNKCVENADDRGVARECYCESPYFLLILLYVVILSLVLFLFT